MGFNKRKHFEDNLKAIEIAFNSSEPSPDELEILSRYSGFGSLKCILFPAEKDSYIER